MMRTGQRKKKSERANRCGIKRGEIPGIQGRPCAPICEVLKSRKTLEPRERERERRESERK